MLNAALAAARRDVGWHVSPQVTGETVVLDGPGGRTLQLPTRRLTALTGVVEDGTTLDVSTLEWSETGAVRKAACRCWSHKYRALEVTMSHGYTEDEAADFRQAILMMVDQMSLLPVDESGRSASDLTRKRVDDVEYQWSDGKYLALAQNSLLSVQGILSYYRLDPVYFA